TSWFAHEAATGQDRDRAAAFNLEEDGMSKWMSAVTLAGMVAVGLPACATKGFVRNRVGEVNGKVDNLTTSVEETQERTKKNEAAISSVDQKAQAAGTAANQAQQQANTANSAA